MKTTLSLFFSSLLLFLLPPVNPVLSFALRGCRANGPLIVLSMQETPLSFLPLSHGLPGSSRACGYILLLDEASDTSVAGRHPTLLVGSAPPPPALARIRPVGRLFALWNKSETCFTPYRKINHMEMWQDKSEIKLTLPLFLSPEVCW